MAPPIKNDSEGKALIIAALEKSGDVDLAKWLEGKPHTGDVIPTGAAQQIILVVEDEEEVRQSTADMLRELGYTVIAVDSATAALRVLDEHSDLTLLFTNVVMPDINGRKLAEEAQRRKPDLKVLYTSGYTRNAIIHLSLIHISEPTRPY